MLTVTAMHQLLLLFFIPLLLSCHAQDPATAPGDPSEESPSISAVEAHFHRFDNRTGESISTGTTGNGSLKNGYPFPFSGRNFHYFDTTSYLNNRCFVHKNIRNAVLNTYAQLDTLLPGRNFGIMECSNENGGKIAPHRTHQNGLSVDFMSPLIKAGQPYLAADYTGAAHYLMDFDNDGNYTEDPSVGIDFETIAHHLLLLEANARRQGFRIAKVIWKTELREELFATPSGKKLKASGIYITTQLTPLINALHDDHYHVDFMPL